MPYSTIIVGILNVCIFRGLILLPLTLRHCKGFAKRQAYLFAFIDRYKLCLLIIKI